MTTQERNEIARTQAREAGNMAIEQHKPAQGHTPGPWEVRLSSGSDGRFISIIGETWPLAHVYTNEIVECEANARLIAAAPDLLAACKEADALLNDTTAVRKILRAAIAKATKTQ